MALEYKDRVKDQTTTTGTGTVTIDGIAPAGYRTITSAYTTGATIRYCIISSDLSQWEVGEGIWTTTGSTLTRATVYASSNAGALVNFSAGTKTVFTGPVAADLIPVYRKNAIINGDFNIWQRGTSFASPASGTTTADRWRYSKAGTMVHDISRSTDVPTVAQAGRLFNYSFLVDCTTAHAAMAAGDVLYIDQAIEGYNWLPLAQRALTLSFWVKATKTGTYCAFVYNNGGDRCFVSEFTVNTTATWEKKLISIPASPSAGTWDYTNGVGARVGVCLAAGTDFHTTAGSWQTTVTAKIATANQVNAADNVANNFQITGVQLEAGSVATKFEYRTFQDELALCLRYYAKTFPYDTAPAQNSGSKLGAVAQHGAAANQSFIADWRLPVVMRAAPTVVTYSPDAANANWGVQGGAIPTATVVQVGDNAVSITGTTSVFAGGSYHIHATATAEL